ADVGTGLPAQAALALAREDLDDAADRIGAVQARRRPAQDLDAFDLRQVERLEFGLAERRRADSHAVDQDHGAVRARAADEVARALARPAVADDLHAGDAPEQILDRIGARLADGVAVDHDDVGRAAAERFGL